MSYATIFAQLLDGFEGDGEYTYHFGTAVNPNAEPALGHDILRLRAKDKPEQRWGHPVENELADLYSYGCYNWREKESGRLMVKDGEIIAIRAHGTSWYGVPVVYWEEQPSAHVDGIRKVFSDGKAGGEPKPEPWSEG
jgi:hypothetical protein